MSADALRSICACGAFWLALRLHDRRERQRTPRFGLSLLVGAVLARLGCAWVFERAPLALDPRGGFSLLFLPLGLAALAPWGAAFASLPVPLALARLGCVFAGCCRGVDGEPLPTFEIAGFGLLHLALRVSPIRQVPARFLIAFGALRIAELPWRPASPAAFVSPEAIAALHVATGAAWLLATWRAPRVQEVPRTMPDVVSASRTNARTRGSQR